MRTLLQDIRYGLRVLRKSPGFTLVAVVTLALGVGANTAIFQLIDAVRLRALPVKDPQELVGVQLADTKGQRGSFNSEYPAVTNAIWEQIRDRQQAFSGVFAWGRDDFNLAEGGEARLARGLWVSGDLFGVLGVRPELGRLFSSEDDRKGCGSPGVVLSHAFWRREFGGDPSVVGRKMTLEGRPFEIVGVTPASFYGLEVGRSFDLAVPVCSEALLSGEEGSRLASGSDWWLIVMGRLKPGWTEERAAAHLAALSPGIFEDTLPAKYPPDSVQDYRESRLTTFPAAAGVSLLRENRSAPTTSTSESATCETTSARRRLKRPRPAVTPRPKLFTTAPAPTRVARRAGASPKSAHVTTAAPALKASTRQSIAVATKSGSFSVLSSETRR